MSQPNSDEYSVRSLAEILREHGLETELGTRPGRRRRSSDDPEVTGRSPRVEPAPRASRAQSPGQAPVAARSSASVRAPGQAPAGARSSAPAVSSSAPARAASPSWSAQPASGARPAAGLAAPATSAREPAPGRASTPVRAPAPARPEPPAGEVGGSADERLSAAGRVGDRADVAPPSARHGRRRSDRAPARPAAEPAIEAPAPARGPSTAAIPALGASTGSRRADAHPVTGPIPAQRTGGAPAEAQDEEPLTGRQSALAWARFAGELVVALAVGIGLYFAFTVLWQLMPYVALVAAPVSVTALVAGVAAWRQRTGQGTVGVRLLAVLLLAGTVLVIAPAAGLLAG